VLHDVVLYRDGLPLPHLQTERVFVVVAVEHAFAYNYPSIFMNI